MPLRQVDDHLWVHETPQTFLGLHVGTRMSVVRLADGDLWVHSPTHLEPQDVDAVGAVGRVGSIVAPNLYHHLYLAEWTARFPQARVYGPRKLAKKRRDIAFDGWLEAGMDAPWTGELEPLPINGSMLGETVFYHQKTRTIFAADLVENFDSSPHFLTRQYLKVAGIERGPGFSRLLRPTVRDRKAFSGSLDHLLSRDIERIVIAHGAIIDRDAKQALRNAFAWL